MADNNRQGCGVGVLFNPALADFVPAHRASLDYLAVIPDRLWIDRGSGARPRFETLGFAETVLRDAACDLPIVLHGIGMSLCSADLFDREYLEQLACWRARYGCPWVSEHLSFTRIGAGHETNASVALPVAYDGELLELLKPRIHEVQARLGCRFLLENNVYYVTFADQDMTEPQFLNTLTQATGCGLLLDLHNVYTNSRNHGFDPRSFVQELDCSQVVEVHVAGGTEQMGFYTDSHTGPVVEEVWDLLAFTLPRTPNLRAVTFEFHESSWPLLKNEGVLAQLERARSIVAGRGGPRPLAAAARNAMPGLDREQHGAS